MEPPLEEVTTTLPLIQNGGTISGFLPSTTSFAVNYPGYPSSISRAIHTLGGLPQIAKARASDSNFLELRFRPEDPHSHPAFGELRPFTGLLLKISKTRTTRSDGEEEQQLSAGVVGRVNKAYHWDGMVDYQHVLPVHVAQARRNKRRWEDSDDQEDQDDLEKDDFVDMDQGDVMMLVPPLFSLKDKPEKIVLNQPAKLCSKNIQRGVVEHRWEMSIEPCLAIAFNIEKIPTKVNWEDKIQRGTNEWKLQSHVGKLFEERPIWPRCSLHERLLDDGLQVSENQLKRFLFRIGYYFSTGPFGRFWIRKGYDPRKDPESRIYQKIDFRVPPQLRSLCESVAKVRSKHAWKNICRFQLLPSKIFTSLQFFELEDDFIQQEIGKPTEQTTCEHEAGWFSRRLLKTLRLHVSIRFLSIFPNGGAEDLLKSTRELFERSKRKEVLSRFWKPEKEHQNVIQEADISAEVPCVESDGTQQDPEAQDGPVSCEVEEEEEEEEEELDAYVPPLAGEDGSLSLEAGSYQIGESIPNVFLQELLHGFPFSKDGIDLKSNGAVQDADLSDGEYQIYEQDSDGNYDDEDDF